MNKFFSLLAATVISMSSYAQTGGKISGAIKDGGNQKIIDAASVSLLQSKDSGLVKVAVADAAGNFYFENIKEGNYLVMATSVGHTKAYSQSFSVTAAASSVQLAVLQLIPVGKNLKEVVVSSKKPFIERKADRTIINVESSITSAGSTALEVLEKSPGVTVDKDGNISLKGKQGVMILLDGKPSYLSGTELTNLLKNMSASNLDQIEIMTNPSAKYDAAGKSGIINIKTKKNRQKGFNGSASTAYGQGKYAKTNNSLNLNYRNGKLNLFSTFSANGRVGFQELDLERKYKNNDQSLKAIFEQQTFMKHRNNNFSAKIGADYYLSKKTTFGVVLTGVSSPEIQSGINTSFLKNNLGNVDSIVVSTHREDAAWRNGGVNLNFRHQFDSTGRELTADLDYINYHSNREQYFTNSNYTAAMNVKGSDELFGVLPSIINIYSAKMDYAHPLKKGAKIEAGVKSSYVETNNAAAYYYFMSGVKQVDYEKTNDYDYRENINAAYLNFNKEWKKWSLQTGLRLENTNYKGHQFGNPQRADSSFKNSYTNLFPTIFAGYNPSEKNQFSISYGRRINRPAYEDLNPFLFFIDKYTYAAGNTYLKPMYADVFELSHTYKQFLTTTVNFSHTRDLFTETFQEKGFATVISQNNYGYMNDASVSVNAQIPVRKWWNANVYTEARYNQFKGILYGEDVNKHATNFLVNVNNQFSFKKGWSAELSGFYRTKGIEGQIMIKPLGQISAGVQKQLLKNKASLKLSVRDIFNTQRPEGNINFQNTEAKFSQTGDNRVATLSFSYRFGKPIKGIQKRKTGGAADEQNRVKGKGN